MNLSGEQKSPSNVSPEAEKAFDSWAGVQLMAHKVPETLFGADWHVDEATGLHVVDLPRWAAKAVEKRGFLRQISRFAVRK